MALLGASGLWGCDSSGDRSPEPAEGPAPSTPEAELAARSEALESVLQLGVTQDTSIRVSAPNKNFGSGAELDVNRALVKLQPAELAGVIGPTDYVLSARLELTLLDRAARHLAVPRLLGAHRMLRPWTEDGATWLCANDTNPANARPDCPGDSWSQLGSGSFVEAASASALIPASGGVVSLDVSGDVRAFLGGGLPNHGWILKTPVVAVLEVAELASAESATPPRLVLQVRRCTQAACDDGNPCTNESCGATGECVHTQATGAACDDGNLCTQGEQCVEGACSPGMPVPEGRACGDSRVCSAAGACLGANVVINEVESNGGSPGDWVELYNAGATGVDLSGYRFKDGDDSHTFYVIPTGTTLAPGGYLLLEEAQFGFGLGSADSARLFAPTGDTAVESYAWTAHAAVTYGRCPDGSGPLGPNGRSTKGAVNDCTPPPVLDAGSDAGSMDAGAPLQPWPGRNSVVPVDAPETFSGNLSGLTYQPAANGPAILWAVTNSPSRLYRLEYDGARFLPAASDGWTQGKTLVYPSGGGGPDSEGVTKAEWESPAIYVATERDNDLNTVSRLAILRFDTSAPGTTLTATHEWNVSADLPAVGPNLGLEAITWVPDAYLVGAGFIDESRGTLYDPALYPDHGGGLFFVGVEFTGMIYAYALDHAAGGFQRVANIVSGQAGSMGLEFDRDRGALWSYCDDTCGNRATLLAVASAGSSLGRFVVRAFLDRPGSLPNLNNEGIAIAPESECVAGFKAFYWADDSDTGGQSLRRDAIPCAPLF